MGTATPRARGHPSQSSCSSQQGPPWGQKRWGGGERGWDPSKGAAGSFLLRSLDWGLEGKSNAQSWGLCSGPFRSRLVGPCSTTGSAAAAAAPERREREQLSTASPALPCTRGLTQRHVPQDPHPHRAEPCSPRSCPHTLPSPCGPALAGCSASAGPARAMRGGGGLEPASPPGARTQVWGRCRWPALQTLARGTRSAATLPGGPLAPRCCWGPP